MKTFGKNITVLIALLAVALAGFGACGDPSDPGDSGPDPVPPDTIPPAAITDLAVYLEFPGSITLKWTVPGDDGNTGKASQYDLRYSDQPVTEQTWVSDVQMSGELAPKDAGLQQTIRVYDLEYSSVYHFAMKTIDEASNVSGLSNPASGTTLPEDNPPATTSDLNAITLDETSIMLIWTAPGDDDNLGTAAQYDIRYAEGAFGPLNWETATQAVGLPTPKSAGERDSVVVSGLQADTHYRFAMKTADDVPNWSERSNVARALSLGVVLATSERILAEGDNVVIVYKAAAGIRCNLRVNQSPEKTCDPAWGYKEILVSAQLPTGTYTYVHDFYNEDTGTYEPPYGFVVLCWGTNYMAQQVFNLLD